MNQEKNYGCFVCDGDHRVFKCPVIKNASVTDRYRIVVEKKLCENCLFKHETQTCKSVYHCKTCEGRHHTLLHRQINDPAADNRVENTNHVLSAHLSTGQSVLLATAVIPIFLSNGYKIYIRALLDQGSTVNIISESAVQLLRAAKIKTNQSIISIGGAQTGKIRHKVKINIGSMHDHDYSYEIEAAVVSKLTKVGAAVVNSNISSDHLQNIKLADPKFNQAGRIDLLLGASAVAEVLLEGLIKGPACSPIAQKTKLGWVLSGGCSDGKEKLVKCNFATCEDELISQQLKKFWELEEVEVAHPIAKEDQDCERQFIESLSRCPDGKYMVKLPFKIDPATPNFLGKSYEMAKRRFLSLERKLMKDRNVYQVYADCINEYLHLNQMRLATGEETDVDDGYFLPHFAVVKEESSTTKVRVVYDASCKTTNGFSLNDRLLVGPMIQAKLFSHLVRWRGGKIALCADLAKMYRMVWVNPEHLKYQKILWRNSMSEPIRIYVILCLLFGTASAAFQAIRVLFQIADDIKDIEPYIAFLIMTRFYVDDFLCNARNDAEAKWIQKKMTEIFARYGFQLRKWISNSPEVMQSIPIEEQEKLIALDDEAASKTLGIIWKPHGDTLNFKLKLPLETSRISKRKVLSEVSQLFDPLGLLSPTIIKAKILLQSLWSSSLSWDEPLPAKLVQEWLKIRSDLFNCERIIVKRWIGISENYRHCSLHVFSDASLKAYSAVVYCRIVAADGSISSHMVAAKTKVAPLKKVTLPRLELCGARLGALLVNQVAKDLEIKDIIIKAHTDSEIVLAWIKGDINRWKPFVANRVADIKEIIDYKHWHHVSTKDNPADCASRGIDFAELAEFDLWWYGPQFLRRADYIEVPGIGIDDDQIPEKKKKVSVCFNVMEQENEVLLRYSTLKRLLHFTCICYRWLHKSTLKRTYEANVFGVDELERATLIWIRHVQRFYYENEIKLISKGKILPVSHAMSSLCPFIDESGFLRVGGRLQNADLSIETKHPYLLPRDDHFTRLIIRDAHIRSLHAGCQATLQYVRQKYWIIKAKSVVKDEISKCMVCFRYKNKTLNQQMGQLPSVRVRQARPFINVGIDFAGYFETRVSTRRNAAYNKCYVALFVCMVTKAIHLELVSSLSTKSFLMAFRRFVSRRGLPSEVFTDRGTNFVGAKNELPHLLKDANHQITSEIIRDLTDLKVKWNLNPAHSPHFGGLWESGVKSMKFHIKRVLKGSRIGYEEFETLLCQIEACLNSRPLCPLTNDIDDLRMLTPGHFLISGPLNMTPEPSNLEVPVNHLKQYQYGQRLMQSFWKLWSKEYLHRLQNRPKWTKQEVNIKVGQLVIVKEENVPPACWPLGRITNVFPGADGLIRVVDVRSKNNVTRKSIHKLCLLPIHD